MNEQHTMCEPLLDLASPDLYRHNPFRVLGVHVHATTQDVQRQQRRRQMAAKLGGTATADPSSILSLEPAPTDEECQTAMERLRRPLDRLLDEVFWFWPTNGDGATDPALQALAGGEVERATALWMAQANEDSARHITTHNLAVLDHLMALDSEIHPRTSGAEEAQEIHRNGLGHRLLRMSQGSRQRRVQDAHHAELWTRAFTRWKTILDGEEFWDVVRKRVRDLNDVNLTTGLVRRIRNTLPTALVLINAKLAYSAAERSDAVCAQRHIRLLQEAAIGEEHADVAIREVLKPLRSRLTTAIDHAKSCWTRTPHHGDQEVRALHKQAMTLLTIVDTLLPADHLIRVGLHDLVAEAMLEGQVAFGKKTNDWLECIKLLELAQTVAVGEAVQSRLVENMGILRKNADSGNDWYCPGYWELPNTTVEQLEAAEAMARAGNYDGAINILAGLSAQTGKPLQRCMAYSLSRKGIRICNEALDDYNADTEILAQLLTNLRKMSPERLATTLALRPDPYRSYGSQPACLVDCGRSYTRWIEFTYNDIPLFMCDACGDQHRAQIEQQKKRFRPHLETALTYLMLADEVDPGDVGVQRNLQSLREMSRHHECDVPTTARLKAQLRTAKIHGRRKQCDVSPDETLCHFCGVQTADDSCGVTVPMCGDLQPVTLLFSTRIEYRYTDVIVPRCRRCRDAQRNLLDHCEQWHVARAAVTDDARFSTLHEQMQAYGEAVRVTQLRVDVHRQQVATAQAALLQAQAIGEQCDQCHSKSGWRNYLCRHCDTEVLQLSKSAKVVVVSTMVLAFIGALDAYPVLRTFSLFSIFFPIVLPFASGLALAGGLKQQQIRKRRGLQKQRAEALSHKRPTAIAQAATALGHARTACETAEKVNQQAVQAHDETRNKLQTAKQMAVEEFERLSPKPELPLGVKPEATYSSFHRIQTLVEHGWGFGHEPLNDGKDVGKNPVQVKGLVTSVSHQ